MQDLVLALKAVGGPDWKTALQHILRVTGGSAGRLTVQGRKVAAEGDLPPGARSYPLSTGSRLVGHLELDAAADSEQAAHCAHIIAISAQCQGLAWSFEQFRKGAAHDIRGSIARASNLVQMLARRLPSQDEESAKLAAFAVQQLSEGEQLLKDLTAYTQAATQSIAVEDLALQGIFDTLSYNQRRNVEGTGGRLVTPKTTERVLASEMPLVDVLERVVSNSLLFAGEAPVIEVAVQGENGHVRVNITDSGPVFEEVYSERIFEPFCRLHGKKFPGHGLGLSTARKLVEGMGGQIKARPATPAGLAIELTLQRAG